MRRPIWTLGLISAALLIGSALAPVSAQQQQSGIDGQVALRSDGELYLISNGQRHWIATAIATDEQINAIPEGEPIFAGLAPVGSAQAAAPPSIGTSQQSSSASQQSNSNTSNSGSSQQSSNSNEADEDDVDEQGERTDDIPIEIHVKGSTKIERGDTRKVKVETRKGVTCELKVVLSDGEELLEDSTNSDSSGECEYTIRIYDDSATGDAELIGHVREGGKYNRDKVDLEIVDDD